MTQRIDLSTVARQESLLDLLPPPPAAPARLLILQCGRTKDPTPGVMPARERYQGPLWKAIRNSDPDGSRVQLAALSAKYGLIDAATPIESYDAELTDRSAAAMIERGANESYPYIARSAAKTDAGRARAMTRAAEAQRCSAMKTIILAERAAGGRLREICIVGGFRYVRLATAWLEELKQVGLLSAGCTLTVINDEIGRMMSRAKAWVEHD